MPSIIQSTLEALKAAREKTDHVAVAYSGGKDSIAILDLCSRTFPRVSPFFMYFVPGLRATDDLLRWGEQKYGVPVRRYPHWILSSAIKSGVYGWPSYRRDDMPEWKLRDVYDLVKADTGAKLIVTGAKKKDSMWRKRMLNSTRKQDDLLHPVVEWSKFDVLGYLSAQGLPIPDSSGRSATGIDLSTPSILWLHRRYPDDFEKLERVFPFVRAVVARWELYGIS